MNFARRHEKMLSRPGVNKIQNFVDFLRNYLCHDTAFETCYAAAENRIDIPSRRSEQIINYKQLCCEVIDTIGFKMLTASSFSIW